VHTYWWKAFEDAELNKLVDSALQNNHDLAATVFKVEQSYARLGSIRSELFPELQASGLFRREQISERTLTPFTLPPHNTFQGAFALSWELDLWGRVRKSVESSIAEIAAQEYFLKSLKISLASSVISAYIQLRELDSMYAITQDTVKSRREYLSLIKSKYKAEAVQELDLRQAESEVLVAETELPRIERLIAVQENLISYLQGAPGTKVSRGILPQLPVKLITSF